MRSAIIWYFPESLILKILFEVVEKPQQTTKSSNLDHQNTSHDHNISNFSHSTRSFFSHFVSVWFFDSLFSNLCYPGYRLIVPVLAHDIFVFSLEG